MAIQSAFNKIRTDSIVKLVSTQVVVKANLDTSSDSGVILGTGADARAVAAEAMQGEVLVNGKVNFKAVFLSTENGIISLDYNADFTDTIKDANITPSSQLMIRLNVLDTDSVVNGGEITLTAVVEITVMMVKKAETDALSNAGEGMFTKNIKLKTSMLKCTAEGAFELSEEIEAGAEIEKILIYDVQFSVSQAKCGTNTMTLMGEAYASVTFRTGGSVMTKSVTIPFTEELDAEGAMPENMVMAELVLKSKRLVLSGGKDDNIIRAEMVIAVKAMIFESAMTDVICDLYSPSVNLFPEEKSIAMTEMVGQMCFKEKISAVAPLTPGMPGVKTILTACMSRNNMANLIAGCGEITAEGLMTACVIYLDSDDKPAAVRAELPYSLKFPAEGVMEGDMITGDGVVCNVSARAVSPTEIEIKAELRLCVCVMRMSTIKVIAGLTEGEKKEACPHAISLFISSGGEEMWDLVKALSASPEDISSQNPNIQLPLAAGMRVKLYRSV